MFRTLGKTQNQHLSVLSQRWERITVWKMDQINDDLHVNKTGTSGHRQQRDCWESRWALRFGFRFTVTTCRKKVDLCDMQASFYYKYNYYSTYLSNKVSFETWYLFIIQRWRYFNEKKGVEEMQLSYVPAPSWNTDKFIQCFTWFMYY